MIDEDLREVRRKAGKKGGLATGKKGLAAMSPEKRREIQRKGLAARLAKTNGR